MIMDNDFHVAFIICTGKNATVIWKNRYCLQMGMAPFIDTICIKGKKNNKHWLLSELDKITSINE